MHADAKEKPAPRRAPCASEEPKEEEAEEKQEDPEHARPVIRAECECAPMRHHFEKCQGKVQVGEGFKGKECVKELCKPYP
ncbi:hypothetical protein DFH09DRAFT_1208482 [Mycena vulgaris]|nr:hypothetical protein DFH09DRAFT_1208482 [Mycena vulgaris]